MRLHLLIATLCLTLGASGCFYSREISRVKRDVERTYPDADLERGFSMNIGPATLRTVGWITRRVPEDEAQMAADYLREIRRVKVGYYPVRYLPPLDQVDLPALGRFERDGWEVAVKVREEEELVWVLYRERFDTVRDLYVLVLSEEELVVASVRGHLDRLLTRVMEDHYVVDELIDW